MIAFGIRNSDRRFAKPQTGPRSRSAFTISHCQILSLSYYLRCSYKLESKLGNPPPLAEDVEDINSDTKESGRLLQEDSLA